MGATIFLFAYQTLYEWLFSNVRGFNRLDYLIIWIILGTTIFAGFMQAIALGFLLALLLFVFRYSRVTAIHSHATLSDERSTVERSLSASQVLQRHGSSVIIYSLRGYLFFGTANSIIDRITEREALREGRCKAILINMHRVTGVDVSALNAFAQLRKQCETEAIQLHFSGVSGEIRRQLTGVGAVSRSDDGTPLVFDSHDIALEYLEDGILAQSSAGPRRRSIREFLVGMIGDENKVDILLRALRRTSCEAGAILFQQGDPDTGMFIVEQGSLSAFIRGANGERIRVKKFSPGSVLGELSAYLTQKHRTATVVADEDSVIYHLDHEKMERLDSANHELRACIHELVATILAKRVSAMNDRMAFESG